MPHQINQTHAGCVLAEREQNGYNDSDWVVDVWLPDEVRALHGYFYASTRGPFNEHNNPSAQVDAYPSVQHAYQRWLDNQSRASGAAAALNAVNKPHIGAQVKVARGRKVPRGLTGTVLSIKTKTDHVSRYGTWATKNDYAFCNFCESFWEVRVDHLDLIAPAQRQLQLIFDLAD